MDKVNEGQASYHDYSLLDADGDPVESVETLRYTVGDGTNTLVDWTDIAAPTGTGTIVVPGPVNRLSSRKLNRRYVTLLAVHDGGNHMTHEIVYAIIPLVGIDPDTVPTE